METLTEAFLTKFPRYNIVLKYFEEANGVECTWENLTKLRLKKFVDLLNTKVAPNTARTYSGKLKSIIGDYNEEYDAPKDYKKVLAMRRDASQHVFLTTEEINRLVGYTPKTRAEWIIRNQFLLGCLTGARHSDYIKFTRANFVGDHLEYVSVKTHTDAKIPLSSALKRIIKENEDMGFVGVVYTEVYFNRLIRRICKACGINTTMSMYTKGKFQTDEKWKFVSSHTARRSFATNLYLHDVDIYTISKLCGHSTVEMTKTYICCAPKVSDGVMEYFDNFK